MSVKKTFVVADICF